MLSPFSLYRLPTLLSRTTRASRPCTTPSAPVISTSLSFLSSTGATWMRQTAMDGELKHNVLWKYIQEKWLVIRGYVDTFKPLVKVIFYRWQWLIGINNWGKGLEFDEKHGIVSLITFPPNIVWFAHYVFQSSKIECAAYMRYCIDSCD